VDILHLTVLNVARHPRILYRLAASQAEAGYTVAVAGLALADEEPGWRQENGVWLRTYPAFHRLSPLRLWQPWRLEMLAYKLKPRLVVIHTPELLGLGRRLKRKLDCRLWYDRHEDYPANIRASPGWAPGLRRLLARWVELREQWFVRMVLDQLTEAEYSYGNRYGAARYACLPNAFAPSPGWAPPEQPLMAAPYFLVTGNLADQWGVLEAITLWAKWKAQGLEEGLVIVGHAPRKRFARKVRRAVRQLPEALRNQVILEGIEQPVPYSRILDWQAHGRALFALYQPLPHLRVKIPTKFYEAATHGLPVLVREDWPEARAWLAERQAGFGVHLETAEPPAEQLAALSLQSTEPSIETYSWKPHSETLRELTRKLLGTPRS